MATNREGLTLLEWKREANIGRAVEVDAKTARIAWAAGEDPTVYACQ